MSTVGDRAPRIMTEPTITSNTFCRLRELKQVLTLLERRADSLEKKIALAFDSKELLSRKKPVLKRRKRRLSDSILARKVADGSTIHGLKEVLTEPHPFLHSIWTFLFCACLALCAYHECEVITEYLKGLTISKVRIHRQSQYDFPVILFCPDTWLDARKVNASGLSRGGIQLALAYLINYGVEPPPYVIENHAEAGREFDRWYEIADFKHLSDFFKHITLDSHEIVQECTFCNSTHDFPKVLMYDSICYQLPMQPTEGGSSLSDLDIFEVRMIDRSEGLLLKRSYWRVFVNPDLLLGMSDTHYLQVYPGYSNTVRIRPSKFKSLASEYCITNEEIGRRGGDYSQALCMAVCFAESQKDICKPLRMYPTKSIPRNISDFCHSYPPTFWTKDVVVGSGGVGLSTQQPAAPPDDKLISEPPECFYDCPPPCEKTVYENSVEAHPLIINGTRHHDETHLHFLNEVVRYFGVLSYEEIESYSFDRLVSNVGGMLGLWLGASVVSLIQLPMLIGTGIRRIWQAAQERSLRKASAPQKTQKKKKHIQKQTTV